MAKTDPKVEKKTAKKVKNTAKYDKKKAVKANPTPVSSKEILEKAVRILCVT
jgi:hypothetical protein